MECARIYQVLYTALGGSFHPQLQPSYCRVRGTRYVPWGIFDIRPRANRTALYRRFSIVLCVGNERLQSGGPAQGRATCNSLPSPPRIFASNFFFTGSRCPPPPPPPRAYLLDYWQQVGRGGRDGKPWEAVMYLIPGCHPKNEVKENMMTLCGSTSCLRRHNRFNLHVVGMEEWNMPTINNGCHVHCEICYNNWELT